MPDIDRIREERNRLEEQIRAYEENNAEARNVVPTPFYAQDILDPSTHAGACPFPFSMGSGGSTPVKPFTGDDPSYQCEDYLNAIKSSMILNHGTEPPEESNNAIMWKTKQIELIQTTLTGSAQHWFSFLTQDVKLNWEEFCKQFIKNFESNKSKNYAQIELGNVVRLPNETIKALTMRITKLVGKAYPNHKNETRN